MKMTKLRYLTIAGLLAMGLSGASIAADNVNDLGKSWPNAADLSASAHWHVYTFSKDGVQYIQINDLNGNVRAAFATAGGQFLRLPMGRDAQNLSMLDSTTAVNDLLASGSTETVYQDQSVAVVASPSSDGTMTLSAYDLCTKDPSSCAQH